MKGKFDNTSKSLKILWNCLQLSKKVFKGFHRQPLYLPTQYLTGVLKILAQTTYCIVGHTYFPVNFAKVLRASFFTEHLRATATHFCSDSFPVTNFRCYRNAYISIFLHRAARLWDLCLWNVFMVWASLGLRSWAGVCRGVGGSCGIMGNQGTLISAFA